MYDKSSKQNTLLVYSEGTYNKKRSFSVTIYYVNFEDVRDVKLDNVLEVK